MYAFIFKIKSNLKTQKNVSSISILDNASLIPANLALAIINNLEDDIVYYLDDVIETHFLCNDIFHIFKYGPKSFINYINNQ